MRKIIVYGICVILVITSFILPPTGQIDPSVLMAISILLAGYEWIFGKTIKNIKIDKEGLNVETFEKNND